MNKHTFIHIILIISIFSCRNNPVEENEENITEDRNIDFTQEVIEANVGSVFAVAIGNDPSSIAWGGLNRVIKVKGKTTFKGHIGGIFSLDFSDNGSLLLSGSSDHNIKIWNVNSNKLVKTFSQHLTVTRDAKFTSDRKSVISAEDNHIVYWKNVVAGNTGKILFLGHTGIINSIDIDKQSKTVISGSKDSTIKIWDADTGTELKSLTNHSGSVLSVEFNPRQNQFASSSSDSSIIIWNSTSFEVIHTLNEHGGIPTSLSYHPSGNYIICGNTDSNIYLYDLTTGSIIRTFEDHTAAISAVDFSTNGYVFVSGAADDIVILWKNIFSD